MGGLGVAVGGSGKGGRVVREVVGMRTASCRMYGIRQWKVELFCLGCTTTKILEIQNFRHLGCPDCCLEFEGCSRILEFWNVWLNFKKLKNGRVVQRRVARERAPRNQQDAHRENSTTP